MSYTTTTSIEISGKCNSIWSSANVEYVPDGTIFAETPNGNGTFTTYQINSTCCEILRNKLISSNTILPNNVSPNDIYFDLNEQKCKWSKTGIVNDTTPIKIILNPVGNDGAFFTLTENNECDLKISFKYLFKLTCESLSELTASSATPNNELKVLRQEKFKLESDLLDINNQISYLSLESVNLYYSIVCNEFPITQVAASTPVETITETQKLPFSNTGFGSLTNTTDLSVANTEVAPIYQTKNVNFCLTETGLLTWREIIGENNYTDFINGELNSYTCLDVIEIDKQNKEAILNNQTILMFECTTPFGEKTKVLNQILELSILQKQTTAKILDVNSLIGSNIEQNDTICSTILGQFESIFASVTIDKIDDNNKVSTFFDAELFSIPQFQNLYQYLSTLEFKDESGFFVCGEPSNSETWASGCTSLVYPEFTNGTLSVNPLSNEINVSSCLTIVKDKLYTELFEQSGETDETSFNQSLSPYSFSSNWKSYEYTIPASATTSIINNRIKLNIVLNNSCGNLCVLVDQINMTKICKDDDRPNIFYSQSPGFNITKIIDNKKSWIDVTDYTERNFSIANTEGLNHIRQTEYDLNDDRLILNSKEIDLTMNMASAVENDVWGYLVNNTNLLTGSTIDCSSNPITPSDIYGNPVGLPIAQTISYNVPSVLISVKALFNSCINLSNTLECYPTTQSFVCGDVIKFKAGDGNQSLWITCDTNGLGAYYITDNTNAQGFINNISGSLSGNAISTLNFLVNLINSYLSKSFPTQKPYVKFWDDNGNCDSCYQSCGDDSINISGFISTNISSVNTLESFENLMVSELTDAKNRKILSCYPTRKAVYERYMNANEYGMPVSNEFDYDKMDKFTGLIKSYWDDLIEQVVPATTLWGSVKVYTNTLFDEQKFKYKSYSTILCNSPLNFVAPPSPINGDKGQCQNIEIITKNIIVFSGLTKPNSQIYDKICLTQMNWGSEFVGNVDIQNGDGLFSNNDGFCDSICQKAVWYNMPESPEIMMNIVTCGAYPLFSSTSFTIESFIINNGNELINIPLSSDTINNENIIWVPSDNSVISGCTYGNPTGFTYSNFIDFLNESFTILDVSDKYEARLSYKEFSKVKLNNGTFITPKSGNGFYLLFPEDDSFELLIAYESQDGNKQKFKYSKDNLMFGPNATLNPYNDSWAVNVSVDYDCKTGILTEGADCELSDWGPWDTCEMTTELNGTRKRYKTIISQPTNGLPCGETEQTQGCCVRNSNINVQSSLSYGFNGTPFNLLTVSEVCSTFVDYKAATTPTLNSYFFESQSLEVGKAVFSGWNGTDCSVIPNGNYWYSSSNDDSVTPNYNTISEITVISVASGLVTEISSCPLLLPLSLSGSSEIEFSVQVNNSSARLLVDWGDTTVEGFIPSSNKVILNHTYSSPYLGQIKMKTNNIGLITGFTDFISTGTTPSSIVFTTSEIGAFTGLTNFSCIISNRISGNISSLPSSLTTFRCYGANTITGNIATMPPLLRIFDVQGSNTTTGDIGSLPNTLTQYGNQGLNTTFGDMSSLKSTLRTYDNRGLNYTSGNIGNIPTGMTYYLNWGSGSADSGNNFPFQTITGDIAGLPSSLTYFNIKGYNTTFGDIANLPNNMTFYSNWGSTVSGGSGQNTSGNIGSLKGKMNSYSNRGANIVSGTLQSMTSATGLTIFESIGFNTISGELDKAPAELRFFSLQGRANNITYLSGRTWPSASGSIPGMYFIIVNPNDGSMDVTRTSDLIMDLANSTWSLFPTGQQKQISTPNFLSALTASAQFELNDVTGRLKSQNVFYVKTGLL